MENRIILDYSKKYKSFYNKVIKIGETIASKSIIISNPQFISKKSLKDIAKTFSHGSYGDFTLFINSDFPREYNFVADFLKITPRCLGMIYLMNVTLFQKDLQHILNSS